jgi:diguanylate cyclase (GGDEF)-like protein
MPAARSTATTDAIPGLHEPVDLPAAANSLETRLDRLTRELAESTATIRELVRQNDTELALPVLNRRAFVREGSRLCLMARRHKFPLAALYVNVDDFRRINEAYGRRGGDALLEQLSNHLCRLMRGSDLIGRVGADEFCVLLSHTNQKAAHDKGQALVGLLRSEPPVYLGHSIDVHVTFGALDCDGQMIDAVMDNAVRELLEQRQHRLP